MKVENEKSLTLSWTILGKISKKKSFCAESNDKPEKFDKNNRLDEAD